jgi:hypothetical protein
MPPGVEQRLERRLTAKNTETAANLDVRADRPGGLMRQRVVVLLAAVLVTTLAALPLAGAAPPRPPDPPAVERFDQVSDCWALRSRYSQAHAIWKRSVRAGMEDYAELAAMRGTLRRLQQLGDCLDSPSG